MRKASRDSKLERIAGTELKPGRAQQLAAAGRTIPDVLDTGLSVVFVGINPSLYSAATGHHFARPGNRFWPALHESGWTPRRLQPAETDTLLKSGCGLTNVVARATAKASELARDEFVRGLQTLTRKVARYQPAGVAFLGITAFAQAFQLKDVQIGEQSEQLASARLWVLPNPSGLNAHYQLPDFIRLFQQLRSALC